MRSKRFFPQLDKYSGIEATICRSEIGFEGVQGHSIGELPLNQVSAAVDSRSG
jgi:hypothetical protein